jgi:hypothetical protein
MYYLITAAACWHSVILAQSNAPGKAKDIEAALKKIGLA